MEKAALKAREKKTRKFDKIFGDKKKGKSGSADTQDKAKAPPAEGSVEYWNEIRSKLGLSELREK